MIDFLVIGGGIAGLSAAARLSELGSLCLLEREAALGYHASGRSAAMFEETYGKPSTVALNRASRDWHLQIGGAADTPRGLMLLGSADNEDAFAHDLREMEMHRLTPGEARAMVPILDLSHITQIGYHTAAYDIDTDRLLQLFARSMKANRGDIHLGHPVTEIRIEGGLW